VLHKRAHVIAGEIRYVSKETDRKWEEGDEISVLEFAATEYDGSVKLSSAKKSRHKSARPESTDARAKVGMIARTL
jgi:hypothetical protein